MAVYFARVVAPEAWAAERANLARRDFLSPERGQAVRVFPMSFLDPNHPFFRNPVARWATILLPLAWAGFELWQGNAFWAMVFAAAGIYAFWGLILKRPEE